MPTPMARSYNTLYCVLPWLLGGLMSSAAAANQSAQPVVPALPAAQLPASMPAPAPFAQMTPLQIVTTTGQQFAVDTKSLHFGPKITMLAIGVHSAGGASTIGYYAFDCEKFTYRLMAYPSGQQWQPSSTRVKWLEVQSATKRPPQFPAVFRAACLPGGKSVGTRKRFVDRLTNGSQLSPG